MAVDRATYPDVFEGRLVGDVIQQEQGCRGRDRSHGDLGQKGRCPRWAGEGVGVHRGRTLGISVVSVGDTTEPLLPGGVPDLGREGHTVRGGQAQGRWWAEETHVVVQEMCGKAVMSLLLCSDSCTSADRSRVLKLTQCCGPFPSPGDQRLGGGQGRRSKPKLV